MKSKLLKIISLTILSLNIVTLPSFSEEVKTDQTEKKEELLPPPPFTIDYNYIFLGLNVDQPQPPPPNIDSSKLPPPPKTLLFQLHILDIMYRHNFTPSISITGDVPLKFMLMDGYPEKGASFNFTSYGLSDPSISANYTVFLNQTNLIEFSTGVSFPLGSINQLGKSPIKDNDYLPFPMQLGSGSFDILPSIFYRGFVDKLSWIALTKGAIRTSKNSLNYRFGNQYTGVGIVRYDLFDWLAPSVRLEANYIDKYEGNTRELTPGFLPDPSTQSMFNLDFVFNVSLFTGTGILKNSSLDFDFDLPITQVVGSFPKKMYGLRLGLHKGF